VEWEEKRADNCRVGDWGGERRRSVLKKGGARSEEGKGDRWGMRDKVRDDINGDERGGEG